MLLNSITRPARPPCGAVDLCADRAGGDGGLACEAEAPLRNVAPHPPGARGRRRRRGDRAHGRLELLSRDPWKRALWIGLTIFALGLLLYVRIVKPLFMLRRPYRISEMRKERGDTWTLVMRPDGHSGFRFRPGQFGWLTVWGSPFKLSAHPFSSRRARRGRTAAWRCRSGISATSPARFTTSRSDERVYIDGPYGAFTMGNPADCTCWSPAASESRR